MDFVYVGLPQTIMIAGVVILSESELMLPFLQRIAIQRKIQQTHRQRNNHCKHKGEPCHDQQKDGECDAQQGQQQFNKEQAEDAMVPNDQNTAKLFCVQAVPPGVLQADFLTEGMGFKDLFRCRFTAMHPKQA